jgi:DNA-binding response OmpR family regulator
MNILYIEDDKQLADTIQQKLRSNYNVDLADTGKKALVLLDKKEYDLLIIDYYLPDTNGIRLCKKIRELDIKTPILIFTTNDSETNIVEALDSGADDYLTKPFSYQVLDARVRALIRRNKNVVSETQMNLGEVLLVPDDQSINFKNKTIRLPRQEYLLLKYLIINKSKLILREEIYEHVWGKDNYYDSNTIDVHIKRLRNKLKSLTGHDWIKSIYGRGYKIYFSNKT